VTWRTAGKAEVAGAGTAPVGSVFDIFHGPSSQSAMVEAIAPVEAFGDAIDVRT
jgi:hypothetical protein